MKTASRKAKGRRLQNWVASRLRELLPVEDTDIKPAVMGESGQDIQLSPLAAALFPYSIECKNQEALNVWAAYKQAVDNAGKLEPLLVIKKNGVKPLAIIDAEYFFELEAFHARHSTNPHPRRSWFRTSRES